MRLSYLVSLVLVSLVASTALVRAEKPSMGEMAPTCILVRLPANASLEVIGMQLIEAGTVSTGMDSKIVSLITQPLKVGYKYAVTIRETRVEAGKTLVRDVPLQVWANGVTLENLLGKRETWATPEMMKKVRARLKEVARAPLPDHLNPWQPWTRHPDFANVIAGKARNEWLPEPGYTWAGDPAKGDYRVKWSPGSKHPLIANVVATARERTWIPTKGYIWRPGVPAEVTRIMLSFVSRDQAEIVLRNAAAGKTSAGDMKDFFIALPFVQGFTGDLGLLIEWVISGGSILPRTPERHVERTPERSEQQNIMERTGGFQPK